MSEYEETYRQCVFHRNHKGFWMFDSYLPGSALRWGHWSRFFTREEDNLLEDTTLDTEQGAAIMRKAIDRAYADSPCYTGDIRYQY